MIASKMKIAIVENNKVVDVSIDSVWKRFKQLRQSVIVKSYSFEDRQEVFSPIIGMFRVKVPFNKIKEIICSSPANSLVLTRNTYLYNHLGEYYQFPWDESCFQSDLKEGYIFDVVRVKSNTAYRYCYSIEVLNTMNYFANNILIHSMEGRSV